jgi:hypothetical protein
MLETAETRYEPAIQRLHDSGQLPELPPAHLWVAILDAYPGGTPTPTETADEPAVHVRVSGGTWQAVCPLCGSAQHASRTSVFFCAHCKNQATVPPSDPSPALPPGWTPPDPFPPDWTPPPPPPQAKLLPQVWPADADQVERVLLTRPRPQFQHWNPGETIIDLRRQDVKAIRQGRHLTNG